MKTLALNFFLDGAFSVTATSGEKNYLHGFNIHVDTRGFQLPVFRKNKYRLHHTNYEAAGYLTLKKIFDNDSLGHVYIIIIEELIEGEGVASVGDYHAVVVVLVAEVGCPLPA